MNWLNNFKNSFTDHIEQVHADLDRDVTKVWTFQYEGHEFRITNTLSEEKLHINGQLAASYRTTSFWQRFLPYHKLRASITVQQKKKDVVVLIGGLISLNVIVKIDNKLCFQDKVKIPLF